MKKLITYCHALFALIFLCNLNSNCQDKWETINCPENTSAYSLFSNSSGILFEGTGQGINWSSDHGQSWNESVSENGMAHLVMDFAEDSKGLIYAGGAEGLFCSSDKGQYWSLVKETRMVNIVNIDDQDNLYIVTAVKDYHPSILFSANNGHSWKDITPAYDTSYSIILNVVGSSIMVASIDKELLYSKDKGITWKKATGLDDTLHFNCIVTAGSDIIANSFYNDKNTGLFRSTDGSNWQRISTEPENPDIFSIAYNPINKELYSVRWDPGILRSTDNGITWTDFSQGLPQNEYMSGVTIGIDGYIYASGTTNIFRRTITTGISDENIDSENDAIVYPNPSNGYFNIELPSAAARVVKIELFDLNGCKIFDMAYRQVSETVINTGTVNISSGEYFLKIHTADGIFVKKLIIKNY